MIAPQASAAFVAAMEKVLDLYSRPYDAKHPVVCMDETPRQLIRETREPIPAAPGRPERHDYEYERCGVCNVFMASEPLAGRRLTKVTERRTKLDWAVFVQDIAASYLDAERITLVMDNLNTHTPGSLYEAFTPEKAKVRFIRVSHFSSRHAFVSRLTLCQAKTPSACHDKTGQEFSFHEWSLILHIRTAFTPGSNDSVCRTDMKSANSLALSGICGYLTTR